MAERCHHCDRPMWDGEKGSESLLTHCFLPGDSTCEVYCLWTEDRARITKLEEDLAGEAATSQARLEALQRIARAVGNRCQTELFRVATEAAAMLSETNHGGLSHARRVSMRKALVAAGVPIPPQCSACPHTDPASKDRQ